LPNGYQPSPNQTFEDWTDGCIAVTDLEIDEILSRGAGWDTY
jgi:hypothetical protein